MSGPQITEAWTNPTPNGRYVPNTLRGVCASSVSTGPCQHWET